MSFLTDLAEGNFGNLGHDLSAHFSQDLPWYLAGGAALTGGLGLAGIGPAAALGGAEAAGAGVAGDAAAGAGALGFAADAGGIGSDFAAGGLPSEILTGASNPVSVGPTAGSVASTVGDAAAGGAGGGGFDWSKFLTNNAGGLAGAGVGGAGLLYQLMQPKGAASIPGGPEFGNLAGASTATTGALSAESAASTRALLDRIRAQQAQTGQQFDPFVQQSLDTRSQLLAPLTTGKLPDAAEQSVVNATNDAKAALRQRYANMGLSGSTQEADALANLDQQATAQRFSIAQNMAQTAMTASNQALAAISSEAGLAAGSVGREVGVTSGDIGTRAGLATGNLGFQEKIYQALMQEQISQNKDLQGAIANFTTALGRVQGSGGGQKYTLTAA
jgi:hypothetical protein